MMPCSSGNSPTMPVTRSALASSAARSASIRSAPGTNGTRHSASATSRSTRSPCEPSSAWNTMSVERRQAALQRRLAVLVPEELARPTAGRAARARCRRRSRHRRRWPRCWRRARTRRQPAVRGAQRQVFLVGAHGGDQHLGRQRHERLVDRPSSGTGHSTRPLTSSSSAGRRRARSPRLRASSSAPRAMICPALGAVQDHLGVAQLDHIVGEVADRERLGRHEAVAARRGRRTRTPASSNGTTSPSNRHRIDCSGRTQRNSPAPQRIDFGQGSRAIACGRCSARSSSLACPGSQIRANRTPRLLVLALLERRSRARSGLAGILRAPARGASARGPLRSTTRSACCSWQPVRRPGPGGAAWRRLLTGMVEGDLGSCQRSPTSARQILARPVLHPGRDLLGEQLEQQLRHRLRPRPRWPRAREPGFGAGLGQRAHAADVGGALGDADHAARVQQVEQVAGLEALVVGRQRQLALQDQTAQCRSASAKWRNSSSVSATSKLNAEYSRSACRNTSP